MRAVTEGFMDLEKGREWSFDDVKKTAVELFNPPAAIKRQ
jgi:hypothetical protein